jgi:signal recognition particle subunit SRP54
MRKMAQQMGAGGGMPGMGGMPGLGGMGGMPGMGGMFGGDSAPRRPVDRDKQKKLRKDAKKARKKNRK